MSARDDYPYWPAPNERRFSAEGCWHWSRAMDEIDDLRLKLAWTEQIAQDRGEENERLRLLNGRLERDFADMNNARRNLDTGKVRSPVFCDATHPDTECEGWIWYCSLIAGHLGPHHCAGAAW